MGNEASKGGGVVGLPATLASTLSGAAVQLREKQSQVLAWVVGGGVVAVAVWSLRRRRQSGAAAAAAAAAAMAATPEVVAAMVRHAARLPVAPLVTPTNWVYGHGGHMGAGVEVLRTPQWAGAVASLTPAYWRHLVTAAGGPAALLMTPDAVRLSSGRIMAIMENNPVMAAYAMAHAARGGYPRRRLASSGVNRLVLEWDMYVDLASAARLMAEVTAPGCSAAHRAECARRLAASTLVAHGGAAHFFGERLFGWNMYESVAAASGGCRIAEWLAAFKAAMATCAPDLLLGDAAVAAAAAAPPPPGDHTPIVPLSVFLDVKSTGASPAVLALIVEGLNTMGIHVWAVGSFRPAQLVGLDAAPQSVAVGVWDALPAPALPTGCVAMPPTLPVYLYTTAGDIQHAATTGSLPPGAAVLFNGASLLRRAPAGVEVDAGTLAGLKALARDRRLRLGYYTQEPTLAGVGAAALAALADAEADAFPLGFAYGGVAGVVAADIPVPTGTHNLPGLAAPWGLGAIFFRPWRTPAP